MDRGTQPEAVHSPKFSTATELAAWLDTRTQSARGVRVPVFLALEGPANLVAPHAWLGPLMDETNPVALALDDSRLGIGLADRLRERCGDDARTCVLWLEGRWQGPGTGGPRTLLIDRVAPNPPPKDATFWASELR